MPEGSGYSSDDWRTVWHQASYNDWQPVDNVGATLDDHSFDGGGGRKAHVRLERNNKPKTGFILSIYDPKVASLFE